MFLSIRLTSHYSTLIWLIRNGLIFLSWGCFARNRNRWMIFLSLTWSTSFLFNILSPALIRKGMIECLWKATGFQISSNHHRHEGVIQYFYGKQLNSLGHSCIQTTLYAQSLCSDSLVYIHWNFRDSYCAAFCVDILLSKIECWLDMDTA